MRETTVRILPETDERAICVSYAGLINRDDYQILHDLVEKRCSETGTFRILIVFDDSFEGWEPEAAELNFLTVTVFAPKALKIGYLNPESRKIFQMKLKAPMMKGEIRFFAKDEFAEALSWVRAD
ncbi:MAG: STAS/SEC14 domain-containing protein [Alphaproteobacteria bacterium]|nr:STAS/SEC14 domain-containing protein [Alphaproteobacteria bacterium]